MDQLVFRVCKHYDAFKVTQKQPLLFENVALKLLLRLKLVVTRFAIQFFINFIPHKLRFCRKYFSVYNFYLAPSIASFCQL